MQRVKEQRATRKLVMQVQQKVGRERRHGRRALSDHVDPLEGVALLKVYVQGLVNPLCLIGIRENKSRGRREGSAQRPRDATRPFLSPREDISGKFRGIRVGIVARGNEARQRPAGSPPSAARFRQSQTCSSQRSPPLTTPRPLQSYQY